MKFPWKKILTIAKDVAIASADDVVPGLDDILDGSEKLFDKDNDNNIDGVQQIERGTIRGIKAIKPSQIRDPQAVEEGTADLYLAFAKIRSGLKPSV